MSESEFLEIAKLTNEISKWKSMAEELAEALTRYKLQGFFNSYDDKIKEHDYGQVAIEALAKFEGLKK